MPMPQHELTGCRYCEGCKQYDEQHSPKKKGQIWWLWCFALIIAAGFCGKFWATW